MTVPACQQSKKNRHDPTDQYIWVAGAVPNPGGVSRKNHCICAIRDVLSRCVFRQSCMEQILINRACSEDIRVWPVRDQLAAVHDQDLRDEIKQ